MVDIDSKKEKNRAVAICRRTQRYRIRALEESCEEALLELCSTSPLPPGMALTVTPGTRTVKKKGVDA